MRDNFLCKVKLFLYSILIIVNAIRTENVHAGIYTVYGSRAGGLAYNSVTLHDIWAAHNNQAGLAFMQKPAAGLYYANKFLLKETGLKAISFVYPVNSGAIGVAYSNFGYSLYNENKLALTFGRKFGDSFAAGIALDYFFTSIGDNYENIHVITAEIGALFKVSDAVEIGIHIFHPVPVDIINNTATSLASRYTCGLKFEFEPMTLYAETEKHFNSPLIFRTGLEYHYKNIAYGRIGIQTWPVELAFGFGFRMQKLQVDIAASMHQVLGFSPQLSVSWFFK